MNKLLTLSVIFLFLLSCTGNQKPEQTEVVEPKFNTESKTSEKGTEIDFAEFKDIVLLAPDTANSDAKLMYALKKRRSTRDYTGENISLERLSNLLWAAYGVNRVEGGRTAPTIYARYPITVYVV